VKSSEAMQLMLVGHMIMTVYLQKVPAQKLNTIPATVIALGSESFL